MHFFQNIQLSKDGDSHALKYENTDKIIYRKLSEDEYNELFQKFSPNIEFATPDLMIKSLVSDQRIIPSYRTSANYDTSHFDESITHFKQQMSGLLKKHGNNGNIRKKMLNNRTKKHSQSFKNKKNLKQQNKALKKMFPNKKNNRKAPARPRNKKNYTTKQDRKSKQK